MSAGIGWHDDMPADAYLADPCDTPSLSSSIAHELLTRSPWHAWHAHARLGAAGRDGSKEQRLGDLVHALLLEEHRVHVVDAPDFRTKAAREARDMAEAQGFVPVLKHAYEGALVSAEKIRKGLTRFGIDLSLERIRRERVAVWEESGVLCRARLDAFDQRQATIYDVKTTRLATDAALERSVRDYGYHVQAAAYTSAVEHLEPTLAGRVRFVLLFVETDTWEVVPVDLAGDLRDLGARRWRRAVDAWGRCFRADKWPGYAAKGPRTLHSSQWAMSQDEFDAGELRDRLEDL